MNRTIQRRVRRHVEHVLTAGASAPRPVDVTVRALPDRLILDGPRLRERRVTDPGVRAILRPVYGRVR